MLMRSRPLFQVDEPAVFVDFAFVALFRDFVERLAAGITAEERTADPADENEADHEQRRDLEAERLHDNRDGEAPDSGREARDEERETLRRRTIAHGEELGAPELVELLLHRETPDNREEEQHPHLEHNGRQCPAKPADDAETGEDTENLATVELVARVHEDERRDNADGEIQSREEQRHGIREVADMLIDVRHEEAVRGGSEVPERVDAAEHDDGLEARAAQDVGIARFADMDAFCFERFRTLLCFDPFRRFWHLEADTRSRPRRR